MKLTLVLVAVFSICTAVAQNGPCTEESIRAKINSGHPAARTDDFYLFNPMLDKPVIGAEEHKKAHESIAAQTGNRKNVKTEAKLDRVVVASSGDMAYGYGSTHFSYDEGDSGKHVDGTVAFLTVWKADGDSCKMAASMGQNEGKR